jgi:outer membrane lipoprotein-sorting protein
MFVPVVTDSGAGFSKDGSFSRASDSLSAKDIWNNYIKAIGGKDNLKKVMDRVTIMESQIDGQELNIEIYQKEPDKMKQILTTSAITQDIYYDGNEGVIVIGGKKINIIESELEKLKYESMINFILNIDPLGIKLNVNGIEKVDNKDCYKIELQLPSGSKIIQYFSKKTYLKVKQIENVTVTHNTFVQETFFNNYHEVMGVKYPFSIKENLGSERMDLSVKSIKVNTGLDDSIFVIK